MAKPTTIKDAIKRWEERHEDEKIEEAVEVGFQFQWLPIDKLDNSLSVLQKCEKLSLTTNMIEKITGISSLKNLKILALSRNNIKSFAGIETLSDTLEELWMSYNVIEKTKGIDAMKKLKVLYLSNNNVKDWVEFNRFQQMASLEDLLFAGNPLYESMEPDAYMKEALKRLPKLKKIEGETVVGVDDD